MVELQGGDPRVIDGPEKLPRARHTMTLSSFGIADISRLSEYEQVGAACAVSRRWREKRKEDSVDSTVGIVLHKKVGDAVSVGEPLATIHYNEEALAHRASELLVKSYEDYEFACSEKKTVDPPRNRNPRREKLNGTLHRNPRSLAMLALAYAFSTNRRAIRMKTVAWGLGLQFAFAILVLRIDAGRRLFQKAGDVVSRLLGYSFVGSQFVFGDLGKQGSHLGFYSVFRYCPRLFHCAFFAVLYHHWNHALRSKGAAWLMTLG